MRIMSLTIKHYSLAMIVLFSFLSIAETENFDMTLSGDFQKDYCSLNIEASTSRDLNLLEIMEQNEEYASNGWDNKVHSYYLSATIISISCSEGTYDITVQTDQPDYKIPFSFNTYLIPSISIDPNITVDFESKNGLILPISFSHKYIVENITYTSDPNDSAYFYLSNEVWSDDQQWLNLPDSYNLSYTAIFTIDKL